MIKKILVVNVNWLGDVIFSSPIFKALKVEYPHAKITCMAVPRVKPILESIPYIDEILIYDEKGRDKGLLSKIKLIGKLKKENFDIAFLLHGSMTRALLIYFAKIKERVGYATKKRGKFLTHIVNEKEKNPHRSDHYLNVVESYGVSIEDRTTALVVSEEAEENINQVLSQEGIVQSDILIVLNPGGNWDLKRWPKENWSQLIDQLSMERGVKVVLSGAIKDRDLINEIINAAESYPVNLAGKIGLKGLVSLMRHAAIVVSADSGPLHVATSVGTDVIGIFGPTRPEVTGPRGSGKVQILQNDVTCNREPCYNLDCSDNICMKSVSVDDVMFFVRHNLEGQKQ